MKTISLCLGLALCWLSPKAPAQAIAPPPAPVNPADDLAGTLFTAGIWSEGRPMPGEWRDVSIVSKRKSRELKVSGSIFGAVPQQVQAHYEDGKLQRMDIIFLEVGNFFGVKESSRAEAAGEELSNRQKRKLEEIDETAAKPKREEFAKRFRELESAIPAALAAFCGGNPGKSVSIGRDRMLRVRSTEFANEAVRFRFTAEDEQLVSLAVIPVESVGTKLVTSTGIDRRKGTRDRVAKLANGDVVINDIPMVNQGSRGYCAIGTLAMIMQFYSVNVNIDQLAAAAGYKEGDTDNARIIPIYEAAAKEGKIRMQRAAAPLKFRDVMRELDKGQPILMWRYFSYERDAVHRKFSEDFAKNPALTLPDPQKDRAEQAGWPNRDSGGHASLITGYNKERNEILFTESWGENNRNRRMRAEEMEACVYHSFNFEP
jgi:hypothetical protein